MIWKIVKLIAWFVAPAGLLTFSWAAVDNVPAHVLDHPDSQLFLIGSTIGFLAWRILRRRLSFFQVFQHELTHLIFGLLFLYSPRVFVASEKEGMVGLYGKNFLITLAPYYFPVFSYFLLPFYPLLRPRFYPAYFFVLGLITGFHVLSKLQDFRFNQPDIKSEGKLFSLLFCLFAACIFFGFLFYFSVGGFSEGLHFFESGFALWQDFLVDHL